MKLLVLIAFLFAGFCSSAQIILAPAEGDRFYYHFNGKEYCDAGQPLKLTICEYRGLKDNTVWVQNHSISASQFNKLRAFIGDDKAFNCASGGEGRFFVYQVIGGKAVIGTAVDILLLQARVKQFFVKKG